MRPLEMKLLKHFWVLASPESPKLDLMEVVFSEWVDFLGWQNIGMKHKDTGLEHGILRIIHPDEQIEEGTYRNGQVHGLKRVVH